MEYITQQILSHLWALIFCLFAVFFTVALFFSKRTFLKYINITLISLCCSLALAEVYFSLRHISTYYEPVNTGSSKASGTEEMPCNATAEPDPVLGYRPIPRHIWSHCVKKYGSTEVYDATYTSLDSGWRVTPQRGDTADTAVVFFGCSFTFGEGLKDSEAFPYRVGQLLGDRYQVFNLGFSGYGAHQMLAEIESGRLDPMLGGYKKTHFYFLTIESHVERCGGLMLWDRDSRRYELDHGEVVDTGTFREHLSLPRRLAEWVFRKSFVFELLFNRPKPAERKRMTELHLAILEKCNKLLLEKYGQPLVVLLWPGAESFKEPLTRAGVATVELAPLLPGYRDASNPYRIPHDGHPNARAASIIAETIVGRIRAEDSQ